VTQFILSTKGGWKGSAASPGIPSLLCFRGSLIISSEFVVWLIAEFNVSGRSVKTPSPDCGAFATSATLGREWERPTIRVAMKAAELMVCLSCAGRNWVARFDLHRKTSAEFGFH